MRGDEFFRLIANRPSFTRMHPRVAAFFKEYLSNEKVIRFGDRYVLNTHFPPYPGKAFDTMAAHFNRIGESEERSLYSVTLAVTNRCGYRCWHCYNAGRSQEDTPLPVLREVASDLQEMGVASVTLTGGEPLLRGDLEEIASGFDDRTTLKMDTTGAGLTPERAAALKERGLFAVGVSLDSADPDEHDRMRGKRGAFETALRALRIADDCGLYPYVITVATREFLQPERFRAFLRFIAKETAAREVHLLEPSASGRLTGNRDVLLSPDETRMILEYQEEVSRDESLPILSTFAHLESPEAFGCGAGLTHLYIDGSGEVCPCNLVPLSFGNIRYEPLRAILERMGKHFRQPRPACVGKVLGEYIEGDRFPLGTEESAAVCETHLPREHSLPRFFRIRGEALHDAGGRELRSAYDAIHGYYDEFWLKEAAAPIREVLEKLPISGAERVFEAGCGTGYATVLLASRLNDPAQLTAVDLSGEMLSEARHRAHEMGLEGIGFIEGDALVALAGEDVYDLVFSSWVLGYIPTAPFFERARHALKSGGRLAFIVHKENSPREELELFAELVAENPAVLRNRVWFDFPPDTFQVERAITASGLRIEYLAEGAATFRYDSPGAVLEHLLKSGAGTVYYDAVDPAYRASLEGEFLRRLDARHKEDMIFTVVHECITCIAGKP